MWQGLHQWKLLPLTEKLVTNNTYCHFESENTDPNLEKCETISLFEKRLKLKNEDRRSLRSACLHLSNTAPVSLGLNCHHRPISARHWKLKMTAPSWSDNRVGLCIICVSMTPQPKLFHYLLSGLIYMLKGEMTGWNLVESCMRESPRGWWAIVLCHPPGFLWEERVEPHKCNPFCPSLGPQVSQKNIMVSVMARKAASRAKQTTLKKAFYTSRGSPSTSGRRVVVRLETRKIISEDLKWTQVLLSWKSWSSTRVHFVLLENKF